MRIGRLILILVIVFAINFVIVKTELISINYFIKTEFLFTFLGVFIGFALTLYTYLTSMFENIKNLIRDKYSADVKKKESKLKLLPQLHSEIKDNIIFLIYSLIIVVLISLLDDLILKAESFIFEINNIKKAILLTIFVLSVYALKDLVNTSFAISDFVIGNNSIKNSNES